MMTTLEIAMFLLGLPVGYALCSLVNIDDPICTLDDYTPIVRWWHRCFGHGEIGANICWACGQLER